MKLPFKIDLKDKVVVITGAGGVLCSMFADALASLKAKVALLDLNYDAAKKVSNEINEKGGISIPVKANVLEKESLMEAKAVVNEKLGKCDILINGAGGNNPRATTTKEYFYPEDIDTEGLVTFFNLDPKGVEFVFNLNFIGTLLPTQVFASDMVGKKGSTIINISSMNAFTPLTKIPAYSGAKAAISNFTQWLAVHFSKVGIRVNAIAPGFFVTNQNEALLINKDGTFTERSNKILAATPMNRFGKPEELIGALLYLVDEKSSSFVNGIVLPVDGGFSAYSGV
ncbi:MAG TPA: SDR family oxidoreductase [Clostridia bacterium]|nr:MAG: putative oxidoreductase [Firmicutes bacterium ADurb.Bin146]HOD93725.1 SDR family oxidoreductase [Clostridia bacterium]HQM39911.1 SDR family oxidoreductase [Clostridia bacterium]